MTGMMQAGKTPAQWREIEHKRARAQETAAWAYGPDNTPYGCTGDHCPQCGRDWKAPHDRDCPHYVICLFPPGCEEGAVRNRQMCQPHLDAVGALFGMKD